MPASMSKPLFWAATLASIIEASPVRSRASPGFTPWTSGVNALAIADRSLLRKREITTHSCGLYSSADVSDNHKNLENLRSKGDDFEVRVAASSCNRVGCYNTSGVYVCNDQSTELVLTMKDVTDNLDYLHGVCVLNDTGNPSMSGRVYLDDHGGWNLNSGYCNGDHSPSSNPAQYSWGTDKDGNEVSNWPGPNGTPQVQCNKEGSPDCEGSYCVEGSIVVEAQETVTCSDQDYLSGSYAGAAALLVYSTTRTITEGWNIGGWLGIDTGDLAKMSAMAGFSASYTKTTTVGSTSGVSESCGSADTKDSFTCGMHIRPQYERVRGYCTDYASNVKIPYEVESPQVADDGQGAYYYRACACEQCGGTDSPDAPELCEIPCTISVEDCKS